MAGISQVALVRVASTPKEGIGMEANMIGAYGPWASGLSGQGPARLSFRQPRFQAGGIDAWRAEVRERLRACLLQPDSGGVPKAQLQHELVHDGLHIEHLSWQLPYGPPTEAVFLKPAGARGRLPAVLGLHDHGGNKYFGWRKIAQIGDQIHPMMKRHRDDYYGGLSWANELARPGSPSLSMTPSPLPAGASGSATCRRLSVRT